MIAVHLEKGRVSLESRPQPERLPGHALIRMLYAGICSTDLHLRRGYYHFSGTPGHEFVGEVVACDGPRWRGKTVVGEINLACGTCASCVAGMGRHCPARTVLGIVKHPGAFAEFLTLPEENLHRLPKHVPVHLGVFTEPIAAACEILDQVKIPKGVQVAVLGDGKLGLLIAQVLQLHGASVHLFGRHKEKMRLVESLGIDTEVMQDRIPLAQYRFVVECTGSSAGLNQAVQMVTPRGTLIMKSTVHGKVTLDTAPIIVQEITMVGSRCGRFAPALKLLASGNLILEPLIHDRLPLGLAAKAFDRAAERGVLKVLLEN